MDSINIRLAKDDDKSRWNDFVLQVSDSPSHLYEWKGIFESAYGYEGKYLVAEDGKRIVGIFPITLLRSRLFGVRLCSLPFSDYGGPLFANDEDSSKMLDLFLDHISPYIKQVDYFEVRSPTQPEATAYLRNSLELGHVIYVTSQIDLPTSFDEIWQDQFRSDLRRKIRKAVKNGVRIVEKELKEGISDFYRVYLYAMKRLGSPPHKFEFFRLLQSVLGDNHVKLFLTALSDKVIGAGIVFLGKSNMYYAYEVTDPEYRKLRSVYLLYSRMLQWGCENHFRVFNTGRTLRGSGIHGFKRQWGGKEQAMPYFYMGEKIPQEDPRERYSFVSKLWGKLMPIAVTKRMGPYIKGGVGH